MIYGIGWGNNFKIVVRKIEEGILRVLGIYGMSRGSIDCDGGWEEVSFFFYWIVSVLKKV